MNNIIKKNSLSFFCLLSLMFLAGFSMGQNTTMVLEGVYQGRDIYVKNPFGSEGVGFCVFEVEVNDKVTSDEVNSSAFAIDMSVLGLNDGDPIVIKIKHRAECLPLVLNPEAIKPKSTFEIVNMSVTGDGVIKWTAKGETGKLPYIIEQFRWNKWVKAGEMMGVGSRGIHEYTFQVRPHSGLNKIRIKQVDFTNQPRFSEEREFVNNHLPKVTFEPKRADNTIRFSMETQYEIFDQYGNLIKRGLDRQIDITNLTPGPYYLNYDNSFGETFIKKK